MNFHPCGRWHRLLAALLWHCRARRRPALATVSNHAFIVQRVTDNAAERCECKQLAFSVAVASALQHAASTRSDAPRPSTRSDAPRPRRSISSSRSENRDETQALQEVQMLRAEGSRAAVAVLRASRFWCLPRGRFTTSGQVLRRAGRLRYHLWNHGRTL